MGHDRGDAEGAPPAHAWLIDAEGDLSRALERPLRSEDLRVTILANVAAALDAVAGPGASPAVIVFSSALGEASVRRLADGLVAHSCAARLVAVETHPFGLGASFVVEQNVALVPSAIDAAWLSAFVKALASPDGLAGLDRFRTRYRLSRREYQVLRLTVAGHRRKELTDLMGCQASTINVFWSRILKKTASSTPAEALLKAIRTP